MFLDKGKREESQSVSIYIYIYIYICIFECSGFDCMLRERRERALCVLRALVVREGGREGGREEGRGGRESRRMISVKVSRGEREGGRKGVDFCLLEAPCKASM